MHSLGGLVVKQCIVFSILHNADVSKLTEGLIFFGTPHDGSKVASFGARLMKPWAFIRFAAASDSVKELRQGSDTLVGLTQDFEPYCSRYPTLCFRETKKTYGYIW